MHIKLEDCEVLDWVQRLKIKPRVGLMCTQKSTSGFHKRQELFEQPT